MKLHFDQKADALYLRLSDAKIVEPKEVQPGIILDFDEHGQFIAIEILGVKESAPGINVRDLKVDVA